MAVKNEKQLIAAVESAKFGDVLGTHESEWVDFKEQAYKCVSAASKELREEEKYELAKDVAAFANDQGGTIAIGYREKEDLNSGVKMAGSITAIKSNSFDLGHYKSVISSNTYPAVRGVKLRWHPLTPNASKGILTISVPRSSTKHIVRNLKDDVGNPVRGVGIPERNDDQTIWWPAERIHALLRLHGGAGTSSVPKGQHTIAPPTTTQTNAPRSREALIEAQGWKQEPAITLQVIPTGAGIRLIDFFGKVQEALQNPTPIRSMGFGLAALGRSPTVSDSAIVMSGSRGTALRLERDGALVVIMQVTAAFAGWGLNHDHTADQMLMLNSVVIVEFLYEVCRFVHEVLEPAGLKTWRYHLSAQNLRSANVGFYGGTPRGFFGPDPVLASGDKLQADIESTGDTSLDTFDILRELYALFGLSETEIPFTEDGKVSPTQIVEVNKHPTFI